MNKFMKLAYKEAKKAYKRNEVPVGAVIVCNNKVIAKAFNTKEHNFNISGHAEINVLRKASRKLKTYILENCDMYVTLEPCLMCSSAITQSRLKKVYYGSKDPKNGGIESLLHALDLQGLNHFVKYENTNDIECSNILKDFFKNKR